MTRIHSVAGVLNGSGTLVETPPFRAPHHSASTAAVVGGGPGPRPGEASLAHHGVLLLDEFPEFQRPVLEALRQPLEDGSISIVRATGRALFPARFQLVATMNLCPCGGRANASAECSCSPQQLARFRTKLSQALLDRFDLVVTMPRPRSHELAGGPGEGVRHGSTSESSRRAPRLDEAAPARSDEANALLDSRGRPAAALGPWPRTGGARRGDGRGPCGSRPRTTPSTSPRRCRIERRRSWRMSDLALAAFAAETGSHLVSEPRSARYARFCRGFDATAYRARPARARSSLPRPGRMTPSPRSWARSMTLRRVSSCAVVARRRSLSRPAVAVVGARACSTYGAQVARALGRELAASGLVVVSGMARGIDGEAHRGALEPGGTTVAVLGCGVDRDYPGRSRSLLRVISATAASSSPNTRRGSSRRRGAFPLGTASSPVSSAPWWWSRLGSEVAR